MIFLQIFTQPKGFFKPLPFAHILPPAISAVVSWIFDPNLHIVLLTDHLDVLALKKKLGWQVSLG